MLIIMVSNTIFAFTLCFSLYRDIQWTHSLECFSTCSHYVIDISKKKEYNHLKLIPRDRFPRDRFFVIDPS